MTEEEYARLQTRRNGTGTAPTKPKAVKAGHADDYDLLALGQLAMVRAQSAVPASPLITTLRYGLKQLTKAKSGEPGIRVGYEAIEQAMFLLWMEMNHPEVYRCTTAVPMGGYRPNGSGGQMKGEGAKVGFPDIVCDRPTGGWHGLRIEMKKFDRTAKPSSDQLDWLTLLGAHGYRSVLCRGHQAAILICAAYLGVPGIECHLPDWAVIDFNNEHGNL
jgi:hypothetical protein